MRSSRRTGDDLLAVLLAGFLLLYGVAVHDSPIARAQVSLPREPGNVFTVTSYLGAEAFDLSIPSSDLPPDYLYYFVAFPDTATSLTLFEGDARTYTVPLDTLQRGSIDQLPIERAGQYRFELTGSGQFVVFIMPTQWQTEGQANLVTLGNWTTIGLIRPMWGGEAGAVHVAWSASESLRLVVAEFGANLEGIQSGILAANAELRFTPAALSLGILLFVEDGTPESQATIQLALNPIPGFPGSVFIIIGAAGGAVAATLFALHRWRHGTRRSAADRIRKASADRTEREGRNPGRRRR